jgi:hypothetical protein
VGSSGAKIGAAAQRVLAQGWDLGRSIGPPLSPPPPPMPPPPPPSLAGPLIPEANLGGRVGWSGVCVGGGGAGKKQREKRGVITPSLVVGLLRLPILRDSRSILSYMSATPQAATPSPSRMIQTPASRNLTLLFPSSSPAVPRPRFTYYSLRNAALAVN